MVLRRIYPDLKVFFSLFAESPLPGRCGCPRNPIRHETVAIRGLTRPEKYANRLTYLPLTDDLFSQNDLFVRLDFLYENGSSLICCCFTPLIKTIWRWHETYRD
jgi:hypothetical protein